MIAFLEHEDLWTKIINAEEGIIEDFWNEGSWWILTTIWAKYFKRSDKREDLFGLNLLYIKKIIKKCYEKLQINIDII